MKPSKITKEMLKEFDSAIKAWKWDNSNTEYENKYMRGVYAADRRNLRSVYELIVKGEYENASSYVINMDTILRDVIPSSIWNIIIDS